MSFLIHALPAEPYRELFSMTDDALHDRRARRIAVTGKPGFPCRVSLADAEIGETVILVHHEHQPADTPYHAGHAIFVREDAAQARPGLGEVPDVLRSRLISVRGFDTDHMMIAADVVAGEDLAQTIERVFEDSAVSYIHLHNAKPGCFAASVTRG
jgi:hypothetical protein